jgi:outer membrane protein OmpA-like peptidoglycan-associated protein
MLSRLRRHVRAGVTLGILLLGALASAKIDGGSALDWRAGRALPALAPPRLDFELGRDRLRIAGTTVSPAHERWLQGMAAEWLPDRRIELHFIPGVITPAYWTDIGSGLLALLPLAESATIVLTADRVSIAGVSSAAGQLRSEIDNLSASLPAGTALEARITSVDPDTSLDAACRRMFAAVAHAPVEFAPASAELRRLSFGVLDRIAQLTWECPGLGITITGHTDALGDPVWNQRLSESRAAAVADYLAARGVAADRLEARGRGAHQPLADNGTAYGRALNRRIEFALH